MMRGRVTHLKLLADHQLIRDCENCVVVGRVVGMMIRLVLFVDKEGVAGRGGTRARRSIDLNNTYITLDMVRGARFHSSGKSTDPTIMKEQHLSPAWKPNSPAQTQCSDAMRGGC